MFSINRIRTGLPAAIALAATLLASSVAHAQDRPRIAVLDFENQTSWWGARLGGGTADAITTRLVESGRFQVVERAQMDAILREQNFQLSGAVDPSTIGEVGRILGVDYLVVGSITSFNIQERGGSLRALGVGASYSEASTTMNARIFSTQTGAVEVVAEADGEARLGFKVSTRDMSVGERSRWNPQLANEAIGPTVEELVEQFVDRSGDLVAAAAAAPALGTPSVVGEREGKVYIDRGELHGLEAGQRFDVIRVVDEIIGSDGTVLDVVTEKVGSLEVQQVLSQSSICVVVEGEAIEGDQLEVG